MLGTYLTKYTVAQKTDSNLELATTTPHFTKPAKSKSIVNLQ
jgi:hypothetical protein